MTADLGFGVVEEFRDRFPGRFVNVGVAEQLMIGVASGLTSEFERVFAYSIGSFASLRCLEQIRNDVCYHNLSVCIVSVGAGTMYGTHGFSHYAVEDIAALRALPNIRIYNPANAVEVSHCLEAIIGTQGPCYLRLGREHLTDIVFTPRSGDQLWSKQKDGSDSNLVVSGSLLNEALEASRYLESAGVSVAVYSCPQAWPIDPDLIEELGDRPLITLEDHCISGGFGSGLLEIKSRIGAPSPALLLGYGDISSGFVGRDAYMREQAGLGGDSLRARIAAWFDTVRSPMG